MNKVIISGRLTKDPETRYTQGSEPLAVTRFSIAINRRFKRDGEPDADFVNCVSFGKTAEFISKYFTKGKMIGIVGSLKTNAWTDSNGQKRTSLDVQVEEVEFLESKSASENYQSQNMMTSNSQNTMTNSSQNNMQQNDEFYSIEQNVDDDNLPF